MGKNSRKMTVAAASRIYSATAKTGDGTVPKESFGARAMRTAMAGQAQLAAQGGGSAAQVSHSAAGSK